jgi:hypothetical protein
MKMPRYGAKIITVAAVIMVMAFLLVNFNSFFKSLDCSALETSEKTSTDVTSIPSQINFIDDDKKLFTDYCTKVYGSKIPIKVDDSVYLYFGTVNGYRFYRLQPTYIACDCVRQQQIIGGYIFESAYRYRPEATGLYIIGGNKVYTLEQAYNKGLVNIQKVYKLYISKT